jgi:hypothetical protein
LNIKFRAAWKNKKISYKILNQNGQVTKNIQTASAGQTETLNLNGLPRGIYIVSVNIEGRLSQQKIIKN